MNNNNNNESLNVLCLVPHHVISSNIYREQSVSYGATWIAEQRSPIDKLSLIEN